MDEPELFSAGNSRCGLCSNCQHARFVASAKGSQFLLCQLSQTDPSFPKYPRLPVLTCSGHQPKPVSRDKSSAPKLQ